MIDAAEGNAMIATKPNSDPFTPMKVPAPTIV